MTGEGIVLPDEDRAEVDRRFAALEAELAPASELEGILLRRAAIHVTRMDRSVREEAARLSTRMRAASTEFDDLRQAEAQKLIDWIAAEPATNARRLRLTPEGVDLLLKACGDLADDLTSRDPRRWDYNHWQRLENLKGRRPEDSPISRDGTLCKALWGDPSHLASGDGEGLDGFARLEWVRQQLLDRIAAEIGALEALRGGLDHEAIALDRSAAATRAIFDGSKEGTLARKYEAAAERGFYRALEELRQIQAVTEPVQEEASEPEESSAEPALGSFFPEVHEEAQRERPRVEPPARRGSKRAGKGRGRPV